nr:PREDICTED: uncharacterized protein LOC104153618 [Struthio camelus australis]
MEVENSLLEMTPEQVQQEIKLCKELCSALEQDCVELQTAKEAVEQRTRELWKEGESLHKHLDQKMSLNRVHMASCQKSICLAKEERSRLRQEKQMLEKSLEEVKRKGLTEDPAMLLPSLPERKMVFKGQVTDKEDTNTLMLTPLIHYPLPGGSGLITFANSGRVVLSFAQEGVAEQLIAQGCIQFPIRKAKYEIKISPYLSGDITSLQVRV